MRRRSLLSGCGLAGLALIATVLLLPTGASGFPWFSYPYTGNTSCGGAIDPVNLVFDGSAGTPTNTLQEIQGHSGWSNTSGSAQALYVNGAPGYYVCRRMNGQRASAGSTSSRYHVRVYGIPGASGRLVAGSAHHEDFVWYCGHAVDKNGSNGSGFDQGRRQLVNKFQASGTHSTTGKWWGNTRNFRQCDGDLAGSDGIGVVVGMNH
jgi:hypothetical protein